MKRKTFNPLRLMPPICCGILFAFALSSTAAAPMETLSTGVGEESRIPHDDYSLKLVFSQREQGSLLAGVNVRIYREGEKVIEVDSPESWLYLDLPPGQYGVVATRGKKNRQSARFRIQEGRQTRIILSWPE